MKTSLLRALKNRHFAFLWVGNTLSRVGDFVYEIALAWWVLQKTGSPQAMSLVLVFTLAPSVLFMLVGGAVVDRLPRLLLMLFSDLGCGVVALLLAWLGWNGNLQIEYIYAASLFFGFSTAFFEPAYAAVVPQLVKEEDLTSANALTSISVNAGRVAGPALGAGLVAAFGVEMAFAVNGVSFLAAALLLLPLLKDKIAPSPAREPSRLLADIREGFGVVIAQPWLWISILIFALTNVTLVGPYSIAIPFLVGEEMQAGIDRLGLVYLCFPLGYILSAVTLGRYARLPRRGVLIQVGTMVAATMLLLFGLNLPFALLLVAAVVNGFALQTGMLAWTHLLQEKIPNQQLGRVASIDQTGSFMLMPVGLLLAGWMINALGPSLVFVIGGGLTVLCSGLALLHPAVRGLD